MRSNRRVAARLGSVVAAIAVAVVLLELSVRVVLSFDHNYFDEAFIRPKNASRRELTLLDLVRPHVDDRVVYELRPGVRGTFLGHELAINSLGMRDVDRERWKRAGTFRIVGLGDSHTFGWGVAREETYLAVLERLLAERFPDRRFEVWNLAVPGYNTVQEVRAFELRVDEIEPDLVIINYVDNDMDLPNFLAERPDLLNFHHSYLRELVSRRLAVLREEEILPPHLFGVDVDDRTHRFTMDPGRIPDRYRALVGWNNMTAAFRHLRDVTYSRGIPAVLLFNPDDYGPRLRGDRRSLLPPLVRRLAVRCQRQGYQVVNPEVRITTYLVENQLEGSSLWIRSTDSHTNPLRHRLVAEALMEDLVKAGLLGASSGNVDPS